MSNINWIAESAAMHIEKEIAALKERLDGDARQIVRHGIDQRTALVEIFGGDMVLAAPPADAIFAGLTDHGLPLLGHSEVTFTVEINRYNIVAGQMKIDPSKRYAVALIVKQIDEEKKEGE